MNAWLDKAIRIVVCVLILFAAVLSGSLYQMAITPLPTRLKYDPLYMVEVRKEHALAAIDLRFRSIDLNLDSMEERLDSIERNLDLLIDMMKEDAKNR